MTATLFSGHMIQDCEFNIFLIVQVYQESLLSIRKNNFGLVAFHIMDFDIE